MGIVMPGMFCPCGALGIAWSGGIAIPGVACPWGMVVPGMDRPDGICIPGMADVLRFAWGFVDAFLAVVFFTDALAWECATFLAGVAFFVAAAFFLVVGIFIPGICMPGMLICATAGEDTATSGSALAAANNFVFTESLLRYEFGSRNLRLVEVVEWLSRRDKAGGVVE